MDLSVVRLKFEVFCLGPNGHYNIPLTEPVYSVPIYNSTSTLNLIIADMSSYRSSIHGGVKILLFCDKINAQDIAVRFFKEINGEPDWEAYGTIQYVHKQFGITFTTPEYTGPVPQTNLNDGIEVNFFYNYLVLRINFYIIFFSALFNLNKKRIKKEAKQKNSILLATIY